MKKKCVVLLSGGLDSTVNLYMAYKNAEVMLALTFDYGQKAAINEAKVASKICEKLQISHKTISLPFVKEFGQSSLVDHNRSIPVGSEIQIDNKNLSEKSAKAVWVPNRNGIFLNIAAGYCEAMGGHAVIPGFNKEEASTFPDNSMEFIDAINESLSYSTANGIEILCYTSQLTKSEIVQKGIEYGVDWNLMWPCYFNHRKWCGVCESCQRCKRALIEGQVNVTELFEVI